MGSRQLPHRRARALAIRELESYEEGEDDTFHASIEEDNVSFHSEEVAAANTSLTELVNDDEIASEAEEWLFFEDQDQEDDGVPGLPARDETNTAFVSRDGTEWKTDINYAGRRFERNFVLERSGLRHGLRPDNETEAIFVIFDDILDSVVTYTNIQGRRLANKKGFSWKSTDREEINAYPSAPCNCR